MKSFKEFLKEVTNNKPGGLMRSGFIKKGFVPPMTPGKTKKRV
jgi:hypothetical protein